MSATLAIETKNTPPLDHLPGNKLIHGPVFPQLIRLALPTVAVLFMTTLLSVARPISSAH